MSNQRVVISYPIPGKTTGTRLDVFEPESPEAFALYRKYEADCIQVTFYKKRPSFDVFEAIASCKGLKGLRIRGAFSANWEHLHEHEELAQLQIDGVAPPRDFELNLPALEGLNLRWWQGMVRSPAANRVTQAGVISYPELDLGPLACLENVNRLYVKARKAQSLSGLQNHRKLVDLDVSAGKPLERLGNLPSRLEIVRLEGAGGSIDFEPFAELKKTWYLDCRLNRVVPSLGPLLRMSNLERFSFSTGKVSDGAMRQLLEVPSLRYVSFTPRRHYDATPAELNSELKQRPPTESCSKEGFARRMGRDKESFKF